MKASGVLLVLLAVSAWAAPREPITIFLAGDSTMAPKLPERRPETGWGEHLQAYFDSTRVRVENHARNGRSTRSFREEGLWSALLERVRPGDYVFIQFGHNDAAQTRVERYATPAQYRENLERFVHETRARGATPLLMTPVMRRRFDDAGAFYDSHGEYPEIVRLVAAAHSVPLVDMHRASERVLRELGMERSKALFLHLARGEHPNYPDGLTDDTHFSPAGAAAMARLAVDGLRALAIPLADLVVEPAHREGAPTARAGGRRAVAPVPASMRVP